MNIGQHSEHKILESMSFWGVPDLYVAPMFNYIIHSIEPGTFFRSVLANDLFSAMQHSHSSNSVNLLQALVRWILNNVPTNLYGSYKKVDCWLELPDEERRQVLEEKRFIYTEKEETWMTLKGNSLATL